MFDELIFGRLTDEQRAFVEDFDNSILVSASAGTGKTTTMIRKILFLLLVKKVDITNLLVVTYTTASASKMKHDLYMGLQSAIAFAKNDEEMISHINRQIDLLNNADIGTIHAFCNKIIKKYFYQLGIDPNYSILSNEKSKNYLMNTAINEVFEDNHKSNSENFYKLYENFNTDRTDTKLRSCILSLYDYLICREGAYEWMDWTLEECYKETESNPVWQYLLEYYKSRWKEMLPKIQNCYNISDACNHDKAKAFAVSRLDYVQKLVDCKTVKDIAKVVECEKVPNKPQIKTDKDISLQIIFDVVDECSSLFNALKQETIKVFKIFNEPNYTLINGVNKNNADSLFMLCKQLKEKYDKVKKENNLLDFNDLEHHALILCRNKDVVKELKFDYLYIFVDEYQDVNFIQDNIITSIAQLNNLYMIGDVKQSIYRFRQSSPEIFLAKYNEYKLGVCGKRLILFNKNFRSNANILGFVNNIFDYAITKDCVGVDYVKEARLVSGLPQNEDLSGVNMSLLDTSQIKEINKDTQDNEKDDVTKKEYEARLIAHKISNIIRQGKHSFKDIAILTRDKKDLAKNVWITLKKNNIPVSLIIKENIFKSNEVIVLLSLLKCVYNEANDIAFATLLKSPIIGCCDNDLAEIRIMAMDAQTYYDACLVAEQSNQIIGAKITRLRTLLREFRLHCLSRNIGEVLRAFVLDQGLDIYYKALPDGVEKECYINEFLDIVDSQIYENDLGRLLDYIEVIKDKESEITISGGSDSVTLMTMHASKGLDFPIVIVGGFGDNIIKNGSKDMSINKDFGLSVCGVGDDSYTKLENINMIASNLRNKKEEFEECVRLMYVALTRPKKELYITGVVDLEKVTKVSLFQSKTYFDIFTQGLSSVDLQYFINKKSQFQLRENNTVVDCAIFNIESLENNTANSQIILDVSNPELVEELQYYHSKEIPIYPHIAFKNSVTSILKEQEVDYTNTLAKFRKLEMTESMDSETAMELGTQYHTIMQYVDYLDEKQDLKKLIDNLVFENKVNAIYLDKIDIDKISKAKNVVQTLVKDGGRIEKEKNFLTLAPHNVLIEDSNVAENVLVQGIVDLSINNQDGAIIVDFKTNKTHNKEYLIDIYRTQLNLYAKAYEMAYNTKVVKKYIYSFEMGELIEVG